MRSHKGSISCEQRWYRVDFKRPLLMKVSRGFLVLEILIMLIMIEKCGEDNAYI